MLLAKGLRQVIDIRLTDVLSNVGLTTGAAYNIWESQDDYRRDLAIFVAGNLQWSDELLEKALIDVAEEVTLEQWIKTAGDAYFEAFTTRFDYFIMLQFWGVKDPDEELVDAIREGYRIVHQRLVALFEATIEMYDLDLLSPYTVDDVAVAATAICEGLALRHRFEPDRVETPAGPMFSDLLHRLTKSLTNER